MVDVEKLKENEDGQSVESVELEREYGVLGRSIRCLGDAVAEYKDRQETGWYVTSFIVTVRSEHAIPRAGCSRKVPYPRKDLNDREQPYYVYTQRGNSAFVGSYQTVFDAVSYSMNVGDPTTKPHPP